MRWCLSDGRVCCSSTHWELTGLRPLSDGRAASVAMDASVGWNRPLEI
jgi:hypothetical protein